MTPLPFALLVSWEFVSLLDGQNNNNNNNNNKGNNNNNNNNNRNDDAGVRAVCWRVKITRLLGGVADCAAGQGDCGGGPRIHNYIERRREKYIM